ncbi:glutamyl-tRNA reductase-binding protein, chloroplastic [Solanum lycopersicum]|uniref:DUF2470 domain-containing protein n=1 Tax=Solanum lycopersicum TaxID=4081 RepID=A0A3Q7FWQ1_SOLLC|nr:glutamyl-tRNA reductase-binding protein, chloroplastic [Solanum lycopersicum]
MASHLPSSSLCVWSDVRFLKRKVNLRPIVRNSHGKPFPAEVSRTILELSSVGTLSTPTQDGWPLGIAVPFAVDPHGTPLLFLNHSTSNFALNSKSSFLVQLQQYGLRTPQCTIQGTLQKPTALKMLHSLWENRFGHQVDDDRLFLLSVERVLQMDDFAEDGIWVTSEEYKSANPDPLRDFAERMIDEINTNNREDILRFCNIYLDLDFQVCDGKMLWVDRLGFDVRFSSPLNDVFEARIPFPREVTDEKGAKSSFNCMSQFAWEVEKNFHAADFEKVKQVKKMEHRGV